MAGNPLAEKKGPKIGDAASLWNFTPSPGWTKDEVQILKLCLMKHGIGRWVQILQEGLLPGKLIQQLNGQTQRLLGQQSLAAYTGLHVDVDRIRGDNEAKTDVERKAGLIINTGPNLTKQMKQKLQEESKAKYGLTPDQIREVEEQIDEIRENHKEADGDTGPAATAPAPAVSLMGVDPATLSKEQKLALLRRLHTQLQAAHAQLQKAMQAGVSQQEGAPALAAEAAAPAKPSECRPTNSNAENEPAAANTDSMEVDPPLQQQQQQQPAAAKRKAPGAVPATAGSRGAGSSRKARAPKPKQVAAELDSDADSDGDWKPKGRGTRGGKGRGRRQQDVDMEDMVAADAGTEQSAADTVQAANVRQLQDMGFAAKEAQQALEECNNCIETALEWLAENCI